MITLLWVFFRRLWFIPILRTRPSVDSSLTTVLSVLHKNAPLPQEKLTGSPVLWWCQVPALGAPLLTAAWQHQGLPPSENSAPGWSRPPLTVNNTRYFNTFTAIGDLKSSKQNSPLHSVSGYKT